MAETPPALSAKSAPPAKAAATAKANMVAASFASTEVSPVVVTVVASWPPEPMIEAVTLLLITFSASENAAAAADPATVTLAASEAAPTNVPIAEVSAASTLTALASTIVLTPAAPMVAVSSTAIILIAVPPAPATASPTRATTTAADSAATVASIVEESSAELETEPAGGDRPAGDVRRDQIRLLHRDDGVGIADKILGDGDAESARR